MKAGYFRILIVQPEQLQAFGGHLPRLAQVLRHSRFSRLVKQVHVDEAHNIYTAGIQLYGQPAFRPAWGQLGELRLWLPKNTPFQALSGTLPVILLIVSQISSSFSQTMYQSTSH